MSDIPVVKVNMFCPSRELNDIRRYILSQIENGKVVVLPTYCDAQIVPNDIENVTTAITAVSEAYPELKSNENYKELMNELSITENLIAKYRSNYNKQVKEYKRYIRKFPTRVFLDILGYEIQNYAYLDYDAPVDASWNLFGE